MINVVPKLVMCSVVCRFVTSVRVTRHCGHHMPPISMPIRLVSPHSWPVRSLVPRSTTLTSFGANITLAGVSTFTAFMTHQGSDYTSTLHTCRLMCLRSVRHSRGCPPHRSYLLARVSQREISLLGMMGMSRTALQIWPPCEITHLM